MKLRRFFAGIAATAMAVSTMVIASAEASYEAKMGAQFDTSRCTMEEWAAIEETVTFNDGDTATLTVDFGEEVAFAGNYVGLDTNIPWDDENPPVGELVSVKLDGTEVAIDNQVLTPEGIDGGLRLTLTNQWNGDITTQPINPDVWLNTTFTKIEITFTAGAAAAEEEPTPEEEPVPETNPDSGLVGLSVAGLAVAGAAVVATKKRK